MNLPPVFFEIRNATQRLRDRVNDDGSHADGALGSETELGKCRLVRCKMVKGRGVVSPVSGWIESAQYAAHLDSLAAADVQ